MFSVLVESVVIKPHACQIIDVCWGNSRTVLHSLFFNLFINLLLTIILLLVCTSVIIMGYEYFNYSRRTWYMAQNADSKKTHDSYYIAYHYVMLIKIF